ncbi:hypothetical protein AUK40_02675 [Candidatus Wirthbacteria bacterium CG2_30_54_11]|uniref:Lipoprotein n=1 Tax=Candidatus Wirthbacteria bacterium CG2_30_54_11 TaxID=1817892 RepID=A0A1J5IKR6_9BACT|nr:MAG: hypothetical protein AUK40_02675 [Candidatus Wirthbacteria bacterium CG2_30_54_11]
MRNRINGFLIIGGVCLLTLSGCTQSKDKTTTENQTDQTTDQTTTGTKTWTSVQAAEEAYAKIKNDWNSNAVFWYMSPTKLTTDWVTSDRAEWWTVKFVTPDNTETRLVYLGGQLDGQIDNVGVLRKKGYQAHLPCGQAEVQHGRGLCNSAGQWRPC